MLPKFTQQEHRNRVNDEDEDDLDEALDAVVGNRQVETHQQNRKHAKSEKLCSWLIHIVKTNPYLRVFV